MSNYSSVTYGEENTPWYTIFHQVPEGSRVLDVGCSSGNLGEELKHAKGCTVIGIDLDADDVKLAAKKLDAAYVKNIETDDFSSLGKFDCVIFGDVIEHLVDPVASLQKIKKILKPDGRVLFSIPNMAHIATRLMLLSGRFERGETGLLDKTHLHFYTLDEVKRVFNDAGYDIKKLAWTDYYVPKTFIKEALAKVGLRPTEAFYALARQSDAAALQYVGYAQVSMGTAKPRVKLPGVSPQTHTIDGYIAELEHKYSAQIEELNQAHASVTNSLSWKVTKPLRKVNAVIKKKR